MVYWGWIDSWLQNLSGLFEILNAPIQAYQPGVSLPDVAGADVGTYSFLGLLLPGVLLSSIIFKIIHLYNPLS